MDHVRVTTRGTTWNGSSAGAETPEADGSKPFAPGADGSKPFGPVAVPGAPVPATEGAPPG